MRSSSEYRVHSMAQWWGHQVADRLFGYVWVGETAIVAAISGEVNCSLGEVGRSSRNGADFRALLGITEPLGPRAVAARRATRTPDRTLNKCNLAVRDTAVISEGLAEHAAVPVAHHTGCTVGQV